MSTKKQFKAAIVGLTRGYPSEQYYDKLINRNNHIYEKFNKNLEEQYPLILFHEGNIIPEHQKYIISQSKNDNVTFIDVADSFKWPEDKVPMSTMQDHGFAPGYRLMCRFNAYHIWCYTKEYDYIFRIDEDTFIGELKHDPFQYMYDNDMDYLLGRYCEETHDLTNRTLPFKASQLLYPLWKTYDYDQTELWVPYLNLMIASTKFFLQEPVQSFLKDITEDPRFLTHRWGDHVIQGIILKAFSKPERIDFIQDFEYMHGSHMCVSRNGQAVEGILSKHEAEVFNLKLSGKQPEHYVRV